MAWVMRTVAAVSLGVVAWACLTAWPAVVGGHPLYAVILVLTGVVGLAVAALSFAPRPPRPASAWRRVGRIVLGVVAASWLVLVAWLRPFPAVDPAPAAMVPDGAVTVTRTAARIELVPTTGPPAVGLVFQPGAKVEARAYAAVLRPLAEAGVLVVVPQQPAGIAFLAMGALEAARSAHPEITRWVVGGHSLGGTVAAMDAEAHDTDAEAPVVGLLLWASYPASDLSDSLTAQVLSVSASEDGLATPETIEASRSDLPPGTTFTVVEGASHASFGDYGPQPGDGTPTIEADDARAQISAASLAFLSALAH